MARLIPTLGVVILFGLGGLGACGGGALKAAGEPCVASAECAEGLVCDFGQSPAVCAGNVTVDAARIDAVDEPVDAAEPDAATTDGAAIDARPVDAAMADAAMIDAAMIDAAEPDAEPPPDAEPDA